jgi:hypothetical protein
LKSVSVLTVHVLPTNKNENKNEIKVTREVDEKKISIITQYFEQPSLLQKWFSVNGIFTTASTKIVGDNILTPVLLNSSSHSHRTTT